MGTRKKTKLKKKYRGGSHGGAAAAAAGGGGGGGGGGGAGGGGAPAAAGAKIELKIYKATNKIFQYLDATTAFAALEAINPAAAAVITAAGGGGAAGGFDAIKEALKDSFPGEILNTPSGPITQYVLVHVQANICYFDEKLYYFTTGDIEEISYNKFLKDLIEKLKSGMVLYDNDSTIAERLTSLNSFS